jgi:hypothetical protein
MAKNVDSPLLLAPVLAEQAGNGNRQPPPIATTPAYSAVVREMPWGQGATQSPALLLFFFGLVLLLLEDFRLAAGLALPDLHPHVLHIPASFPKGPGST